MMTRVRPAAGTLFMGPRIGDNLRKHLALQHPVPVAQLDSASASEAEG